MSEPDITWHDVTWRGKCPVCRSLIEGAVIRELQPRYFIRCENRHCPTRLPDDAWHEVPEHGSWSESAAALANIRHDLRRDYFRQEMGL